MKNCLIWIIGVLLLIAIDIKTTTCSKHIVEYYEQCDDYYHDDIVEEYMYKEKFDEDKHFNDYLNNHIHHYMLTSSTIFSVVIGVMGTSLLYYLFYQNNYNFTLLNSSKKIETFSIIPDY